VSNSNPPSADKSHWLYFIFSAIFHGLTLCT
jgi:hypothetical protein